VSELDDNPYETAATLGMHVMLPSDSELFIDIDCEEDLVHYRAMLEVLKPLAFTDGRALVVMDRVIPSKTLGHFHVVVTLDERVTPMERIAFQAALGSDRKRELLSLLRIRLQLDRPPTVFFEPLVEEQPRGELPVVGESELTF
jgi:hypothetical protein